MQTRSSAKSPEKFIFDCEIFWVIFGSSLKLSIAYFVLPENQLSNCIHPVFTWLLTNQRVCEVAVMVYFIRLLRKFWLLKFDIVKLAKHQLVTVDPPFCLIVHNSHLLRKCSWARLTCFWLLVFIRIFLRRFPFSLVNFIGRAKLQNRPLRCFLWLKRLKNYFKLETTVCDMISIPSTADLPPSVSWNFELNYSLKQFVPFCEKFSVAFYFQIYFSVYICFIETIHCIFCELWNIEWMIQIFDYKVLLSYY